MSELPQAQPQRTRRVAVWNIFLDKEYPQDERLDGIIDTLQVQGNFDAIGILEAHGNNGERIAKEISGTPGLWLPHSRKNEHIGIFGPNINSTEEIDIGHNRKAVVARLGDVAVVAVHLRRNKRYIRRGSEQVEQTDALLDHLSDEEKVIIFGDFNSLALQKPRRMLKKANYTSAFPRFDFTKDRSFPTKEFPEKLTDRERRILRLAGGAINIDDIYTKGLEVIDADSFVGPSDHPGLWAEYIDE